MLYFVRMHNVHYKLFTILLLSGVLPPHLQAPDVVHLRHDPPDQTNKYLRETPSLYPTVIKLQNMSLTGSLIIEVVSLNIGRNDKGIFYSRS